MSSTPPVTSWLTTLASRRPIGASTAQPRALSPAGLAGSPQLWLLSGTPPSPLALTSLPGTCEIPAAGSVIPAAPE